MGRETKFGLLVGLAFIILFGVILSGRASSTTSDHAALPAGESVAHAARTQTLRGTVDPFVADGTLNVRGSDGVAPAPESAEEALPAPERLASDTPTAPRTDDRVTVGFGPVTIETPYGTEGPEARLARLETGSDHPPTAVAVKSGATPPTVTDPSRPTYVVCAGDTISGIAKRFYGKDTPKFWQQILDANKGTLKDPKRLVVGQKLVIPNVPVASPKVDTPKTDAPKTDMPKTDSPKALPTLADSLDSALAGGPGAVKARTPAAPASGRVTIEELGRLFSTSTDVAVAPASSAKAYTIQSGDTFAKIAAKFYGDGAKYGRLLAQKNSGVDPTRMKIGQRIVLLDDFGATIPDSAVASR